MYTNELLEEKYKAQRELSKQAKKENKDYFDFVNKEVYNLFQQNGRKMCVDKRRGMHIGN